jgi:predicted DNA-binding protein (UPF0251 family)
VPRPRKRRFLGRQPRPVIYKPAGIPLDDLNQVRLLQEELEALRLADLEALTQHEAAEQMGISRSTFQRILSRAHRQVALALCEGHALQIVGAELERSSAQTLAPDEKNQSRRP